MKLVTTLLLLCWYFQLVWATDRPMIGILTLAESDAPTEINSYITRAYTKWLEAAGGRVVAIPFNAPTAQLDSLLSQLNGVLFTGGDLSLDVNTTYYRTGQYIYNYVVETNERGEVFPLWGTCQGFQFINLLAAQPKQNSDVLRCTYDSENLPLSLEYTSAARASKLFEFAVRATNPFDEKDGSTVFDTLGTRLATMNLHHCAVTPTDFNAHPGLANNYVILSTNQDRQNVTFISSMEHAKYPILAVQWHPERVQYEWDDVELVDKSAAGEFANGFMATVFVSYSRRSTHSFPSSAAADAAVIARFPSYYTEELNSVSSQETFYFQSRRTRASTRRTTKTFIHAHAKKSTEEQGWIELVARTQPPLKRRERRV